MRRSIGILLLWFALIWLVPTAVHAAGMVAKSKVLFAITCAESDSNPIDNLGRICLDAKHHELYAVELAKGRILVFSSDDGRFRAQIPVPQGLGAPMAIAVDAAGNLYLSDEQHPKVVCIDYKGKVLSEIPLTGFSDKDDETALAGSLAVDSKGTLYAADRKRRMVLAYDSISGKFIRRFGGQGKEPGKFDEISDLAIGPEDKLFVCDMMSSHITVFDSTGRQVSRFGLPGDAVLSLATPTGVAVDSSGRAAVVDNARHTVVIHSPTGEPLYEFGGLGRPLGWFYFPRGIVWAPDGTLFIAEPFLNRIQAIQFTPPS